MHMQEYMAHGAQGLFTQAGFIDSSQDDGQQNPFGVNNPNLQSQVCPIRKFIPLYSLRPRFFETKFMRLRLHE